MKPALRTAIRQEMDRASAAERSGDLQQAFAYLERAHILGQRYFLTHMHTHLRMLRVGRRRRDAREIRGQVLRLIAVVPGFLFGWIPKGNTGGANVSALKPMPIPDDLAPLLKDYDVWRDVRIRVAFIFVVAALVAWAAMSDRPTAASAREPTGRENGATVAP